VLYRRAICSPGFAILRSPANTSPAITSACRPRPAFRQPAVDEKLVDTGLSHSRLSVARYHEVAMNAPPKQGKFQASRPAKEFRTA
jgi:hypothetical protein